MNCIPPLQPIELKNKELIKNHAPDWRKRVKNRFFAHVQQFLIIHSVWKDGASVQMDGACGVISSIQNNNFFIYFRHGIAEMFGIFGSFNLIHVFF